MRTLLDIDGLGPAHFLAGGVAGPPEGFVGSPEPATPPDVDERKKAAPASGRKARHRRAASPSSLGEEHEDDEEEIEDFLNPVSPPKEQGEGAAERQDE